MIEQIVGNLESKSNVAGIAAQMCPALDRHLAQDCAHFHRRAQQRAGLQLLEPGNGLEIEGASLGHNVHHLTARHAARTARPGQCLDQFDSGKRIPAAAQVCQYFKGEGMKRVPCQHRCRLIKSAVEGWLAVAHGIVIHAGQIIMDQRIDMDRFDRDTRPDCDSAVHPVKLGRGAQQQRADPLSAANRSIAHRLDQPGAVILRHRQQRIEGGVDIARNPGKAIGQQRIDGSGYCHDSVARRIVKGLGSRRDPIGPRNNPLDPGLRCIKPGLAMLAKGFAALIKRDRIVERHFSAFQAANDILQRAQGVFKAQGGNIGCSIFHHSRALTGQAPRVKLRRNKGTCK